MILGTRLPIGRRPFRALVGCSPPNCLSPKGEVVSFSKGLFSLPSRSVSSCSSAGKSLFTSFPGNSSCSIDGLSIITQSRE